MAEPFFKYVAPEAALVDGVPTKGMTVRAGTGRRVGHLAGFILDNAHQRIRYLVVRVSRWSKQMTVLPLSIARVDFARRTIEVDLDERELSSLRGFSLDALRV
jgi:hypothetical protein